MNTGGWCLRPIYYHNCGSNFLDPWAEGPFAPALKAERCVPSMQVRVQTTSLLLRIAPSLGDAFSDIIGDIDNNISSPLTRMQCKKVSKPLPYPWVHSRQYYLVKGEEVVLYRTVPQAITELGGTKSFDNLNKTDVAFLSSKIEDLKAAAKTLLEATSWMAGGRTLLNPRPFMTSLTWPRSSTSLWQTLGVSTW